MRKEIDKRQRSSSKYCSKMQKSQKVSRLLLTVLVDRNPKGKGTKLSLYKEEASIIASLHLEIPDNHTLNQNILLIGL